MIVQHSGLVPFTVPRGTYNSTGEVVSFRRSGAYAPLRSAHIAIFVYSGTALVALDGNASGPFIEIEPEGALDFPVATTEVYVKAKTTPCEVGIVAALNPIEPS